MLPKPLNPTDRVSKDIQESADQAGGCNCGSTRHMRGGEHDMRCPRYDAEKEALRNLVAAVICELPSNRDWLDPELEKEMRAAVGYHADFNARRATIQPSQTALRGHNRVDGVVGSCPHLRQTVPGTAINSCLDCGVDLPAEVDGVERGLQPSTESESELSVSEVAKGIVNDFAGISDRAVGTFPDLDNLTNAIASAIRKAKDSAFEEAAKIADKWTSPDVKFSCVAAAIRVRIAEQKSEGEA